ncbi:nitroreductase family protein [Parasphingopyxis marina]|uniref:Putative NAD(P)H nitroreductase n=1 Tax=Parasphingopyxis marina TaxID=2761622 RepID=A0A842HZI5_9SPHN|nr:nitroreductase [Parasphingopyxis marina]MBC2778372.1 nitroreductase [Parasphingopyxis marina]
MFNDLSSPAAFLATRRSGKPRDMVAPGPDSAEMREILSTAMRTPDHGKLAPWRFVTIEKDQREAFAEILHSAYRIDKEQPGRLEREAIEQFAHQAPSLVVVLYSPREDSKIPLWEQELSAGAACMNLLSAAHARGYVGGWLTGWAAFSDEVRDAFGAAPEKIAGFIFLGTAGAELSERPRPDYDDVVSAWQPA